MLFVLLCIAGGLLVGFALGGSLRRLEALALRRVWVLVVALAVQIVASLTLSHSAFTTALIVSLVLAVGFLVSNPQLSGKSLVGLGLAANALVIAVNGAMPVSLDAAAKAGISTGKIADDARHQIADPGTHLSWLDDHIPLALPGEPETLSPGDIAVAAGAALMVAAAMRRRIHEPDPIPRRPSTGAGGPDPVDPRTDELPVLTSVGAATGEPLDASSALSLATPSADATLPASAPAAAQSADPAPFRMGRSPFLSTARPPSALGEPRRPRMPRRRPASAAASPPVVRPPWTPLPVRTPSTGGEQPAPGTPAGAPPAQIPASYRSAAPSDGGQPAGAQPTAAQPTAAQRSAAQAPAAQPLAEPLEPSPAGLRRRTAPQTPARPMTRPARVMPVLPGTPGTTGAPPGRPPTSAGSPLARLATPIAARAEEAVTLGPMELQPEPLSRRASRAPTPPSPPDPPPVP